MKTKTELLDNIKKLEQELHESNNSSEYWSHEYSVIFEMHEKLKSKISNDVIFNFLSNCSIIDKEKLENFIKTL